jgi:hypothetical protein
LSTNGKLPHPECAEDPYEVTALSPHDRFVIALHSPNGIGEEGLYLWPQRKTPETQPAAFDEPLSPMRFKGKTSRIAAIFNDSGSKTALFLCNPDCVAERLGFEPSLPFVFGAKSRWVRYMQRILQLARLARRIEWTPEFEKVVASLISSKGERLAMVGLKMDILRPVRCPNWLARDCMPTGQSNGEKHLRRRTRQECG